MNIKRIITLSRPRFWTYLAGPYLVGYTIAANGRADFLSFPFLYTVFYFLLPANFFLYGINDYFDRSLDASNPRKESRETRLTRTESVEVLNFALISLIFTLPLFAYLHSYSLAVLLFFLLLAVFYSAPPIRLKTMTFLDSVSNILYLLPGFVGYTQFKSLPVPVSVLMALSCWPIAMHIFSAIPDIESDRHAGITTTAVQLGRGRSLFVCFVLWLIFAAFATSINPFFVVSFLYAAIPLYLLYHDDISVEKVYWKFPLINGILGAALFFYLMYIRFYL